MMAVAACLLVGILSGCGRNTTTATSALPPVSVEVVKAVRQDLTRRVVLVGSVEPWAKATLYAKTAGYVKAMLVDKGDAVNRGQVLAILGVPEAQREVEQARAISDSAAADIQQSVAEYQASLRDYEAARAAVAQPEAELTTAYAELEKTKRELETTQRSYEAAQEESREPDVGLQAAEADLRASKAQALEPEADLATAKAELEAAQSELQTAQAESDRAATDVKLYEKNHARFKNLADREIVTQEALDESRSKLDIASATAKAAGSQVAVARSKVKAAESRVSAAEARRDTARERVSSVEARLRMAQQQITTARAKVKSPAARVDVDRGNVALVQSRLKTIRAKVTAARAQVASVQARMEIPRAKQRSARSRLQYAQANMARQTTLMNYSRIEAPFDGVVTERFVDVGAMVQTAASSSGAQPVVTVMNLRKVRVYADVTEPDVPSVRIGNPVTVVIRELPDREFKGTVTRTELALDAATRSMKIEVDFPNTDGSLKAGMFAEVRLGMETHRDALTLPVRCLVVEKQKKSVFVVKDGKAKKVEVQVGADDGINVEIKEGIAAEDDVIISGMTQVKDGAAVNAKPAATETDKPVGRGEKQ